MYRVDESSTVHGGCSSNCAGRASILRRIEQGSAGRIADYDANDQCVVVLSLFFTSSSAFFPAFCRLAPAFWAAWPKPSFTPRPSSTDPFLIFCAASDLPMSSVVFLI